MIPPIFVQNVYEMYIQISYTFQRIPDTQSRVITKVYDFLGQPSYTDGFFLLVWYNKVGIVHCTYLCVSGYNFQNNCILLSQFFFTFTNSVNPGEMPDNSTLFVKVPVKGFPVYKGFKN